MDKLNGNKPEVELSATAYNDYNDFITPEVTQTPSTPKSPYLVFILALATLILFVAPSFLFIFWDGTTETLPFTNLNYLTSVAIYAAVTGFGLVLLLLYNRYARRRVVSQLLPTILGTIALGTGLFILFRLLDVGNLGGTIFATGVITLLLVVFLISAISNLELFRRGFWYSEFRTSRALGTVGLWILALIAIIIAGQLIEVFGLDWLTEEFYEDTDLPNLVGMLTTDSVGGAVEWVLIGLAICILTPITEEVVFRGVIMRSVSNALANKSGGVIIAAVISSLIFMAFHLLPFQFIPIFILSLALSYAYHRWGLFYAIVLHALQNSFAFTVIFLVENGVIDLDLLDPVGWIAALV